MTIRDGKSFLFAQNLLTHNLKIHLKKLIGTFFAMIFQKNVLNSKPNKQTDLQLGMYQYVSSEDPFSMYQ
jgi:hypothetical protein